MTNTLNCPKENIYALLGAILSNHTSDESLSAMKINPKGEARRKAIEEQNEDFSNDIDDIDEGDWNYSGEAFDKEAFEQWD